MGCLNLAALQGSHVGMPLRPTLTREPDEAFAPFTVMLNVALEGLEVDGLVMVIEAAPVAFMGLNGVDKIGTICENI